ncbi:MAG: YraN family protein [Deltaproteobacteria bacterium]|nr:MAG: YraN family protein [Deltaproteobacteria bacterium]
MTKERLDLGKRGEELALKKVKRLGYKCVTRNYRCPLGEVDLVAKDGDCLVFIEIKTRKGKSLGYAKEAIDGRKRRQLSKVALAYMKSNNCCEVKSRFDVVAINLKDDEEEIEVIQNAFELAY